MKLKTLAMAVILMIGLGAFAHDEVANTITISKATELGVHRIERLVTLKKIDAFFLSGLASLRAESSSESGATYKVYGYTEAGSDGTYLTITLLMDAQGKTLSHQITEGLKPASPINWPIKDASSLMEEGLHFVLEGWAQNSDVKPFYTGLQSIVLTPEYDASGNLLARFTVKSDDVAQTLTIILKPDGTFVSHEVK
ncbi:hypothetical protein DOM22_05595 [Bdellovibrio sp. ZAP7]|uniref:hypothetical protein n=1 Tax=Bdellovibrio sp. ZAP7 TaxID=2231053 RepID=UPI001159F520|nr:hypothetical protein [Bdellovibrio sp. ZAP7]QDK44671.1 hypothetical protein DOM22_05595 [Bdellovibrio sp. ZAP7]